MCKYENYIKRKNLNLQDIIVAGLLTMVYILPFLGAVVFSTVKTKVHNIKSIILKFVDTIIIFRFSMIRRGKV